jgi:DNA-binding CsgD family transcriptional regulator
MWLKALKLALFFFSGIYCFAQTASESLERQLAVSKPNSIAYISLLTKIAKEYANSNPDSALVLANRALDMAVGNQYDSIKGKVYVAISTSHSYLAKYDSSTSYAFKAIAVGEQFRDTTTLIDAFNNLGIDYMMQGDDQKSIDYFEEVRALSFAVGDSLRWGHALNNLGMMVGYNGKTESELDYYDQASAIFLAIDEEEGYANTLLNSGTAHTVLEQFSTAQLLYEKALIVFNKIGMTSGIQNTLLSMAENYQLEGKNQMAEEVALQALQIAERDQFLQDEVYSKLVLSEIAESVGEFGKALRYYKEASELKEKIFTTEKSNQIAEMEAKYQTVKKEQQLAVASMKLEQQRLQKYLWIAALILTLGIGGFAYFSIRQKAQLEQRLLAEEIENLRLKISSLLGDSTAIKISIEELNKKLRQPLSEREFEILNLTVTDKTNQEIADEVFVSVNTVKYHLKNVYEKLDVNNRKEALHLLIGQA